MKKIIILYLIILLCLINNNKSHSQSRDFQSIYCSKVKGLRVRSKPSLDSSSKILAHLDKGETVIFLKSISYNYITILFCGKKATDIFMQVKTMDNKEGWVFGTGLAKGRVSGITDWKKKGLQGKVKKCITKEKSGSGKYRIYKIDSYDFLGRLIYHADSFNGREPVFESTIRYKVNGERISNKNSKFGYDKAGNLKSISETRSDSDGHNCSLGFTYSYNKRSQLIKEVARDDNASQTITKYYYNSQQKLIKKIVDSTMEGSADEYETTIYHYNKIRELTFACVNLIINGEIKKRKYIIRYKLNEKGNITQAIQYTDKGEFCEGYRYYYQYWE